MREAKDVEAQLGKPVTAPGPQLPRVSHTRDLGGGKRSLSPWGLQRGITTPGPLLGPPCCALGPTSPGCSEPRRLRGAWEWAGRLLHQSLRVPSSHCRGGADAPRSSRMPCLSSPSSRHSAETGQRGPGLFVCLHCWDIKARPHWVSRGGESVSGEAAKCPGMFAYQVNEKMKPSRP